MGIVVGLIQAAFRDFHLTEDFTWKTVVLIPKGNENFRGIRLVGFLCETVPGIINFHLTTAIQFHHTLCGFFTDRGIGTASLEAKLLQQLMTMREEVLY